MHRTSRATTSCCLSILLVLGAPAKCAGTLHETHVGSLAADNGNGVHEWAIAMGSVSAVPCTRCHSRLERGRRNGLSVGIDKEPWLPCTPCGHLAAAASASGVPAALLSETTRSLPDAAMAVSAALLPTLERGVEASRLDLEKLVNSALYWVAVWGAVVVIAVLMYRSARAEVTQEQQSLSTFVRTTSLPHSLWSMNLIAAIGQVRVGKTLFSPRLAVVLSLIIGFLQMTTLFLVAHDIDPSAKPVTVKPSSPWITSTWSVNLMKWLMVAFLSISMSKDASECRILLQGIMETNRSRLAVSRASLFIVCLAQFLIIVMVVWCGVSAVLSFQAVPDILYSSMAVTFLSRVDEAVFELLHQVLNIQANFIIIHGRTRNEESVEELFRRIDTDGDGNISREELAAYAAQNVVVDEDMKHEPLPAWLDVMLRVLVMLPVVLGFGLISRAFVTDVMPTQRVHDIKEAVAAHLRGSPHS
mmetsp:Transcript_91086/g.262614  ORF Transcript_91086/g.262614 Transcript_91086/m.262614 type:complete len:473 (+) Transcript_91086:103-1521(+)